MRTVQKSDSFRHFRQGVPVLAQFAPYQESTTNFKLSAFPFLLAFKKTIFAPQFKKKRGI
jgi:hypothetical protein